MRAVFLFIFLFFVSLSSIADTDADKYPESELYSKPIEVVPGVWSAIGATQPPTYANAGHNNNLSFVISDDGVLVVNAGASYLLAKALHEEISKITDQPIRYVVNENGQGHAMLGNNYWREQGVEIIAHDDAIEVIDQYGEEELEGMQAYNRDRGINTSIALPDVGFSDRKLIQLGSSRIELIHFGPAHSEGDISVYLPDHDLIIAGDMAFHQRMLPVFPDTKTLDWIETFDLFSAMDVTHVIPGHGAPTDMATVTRETKGYLDYMHAEVTKLLDDDLGLDEAYLIDQSAYQYLDAFDELAKKNAGRIFQELEADSF
ncbi:MAG: MBL fold metallo-hydrolase [Piscirickettsiaceae bacterium]|nr:MBL fold metallo-hydrolase [Piscirickettsiaceae bacterium]